MSTSGIVASQRHLWNVIPLFVSFAIYAISVVGETNRAPFDLPEAESELVGGFHTEYSSFKFAMFFLAEYINMVTVSALATTLFLGGWRAPWPLSLWHGANAGWWPILWFTAKVIAGIFVFVWLRGTLPRLRYDQFMAFGWKVLIPINLVWILAVTVDPRAARPRLAGVAGRSRCRWPSCCCSSWSPALMIWEGAAARRAADRADEDEDEAAAAADVPGPADGSRRPHAAAAAASWRASGARPAPSRNCPDGEYR